MRKHERERRVGGEKQRNETPTILYNICFKNTRPITSWHQLGLTELTHTCQQQKSVIYKASIVTAVRATLSRGKRVEKSIVLTTPLLFATVAKSRLLTAIGQRILTHIEWLPRAQTSQLCLQHHNNVLSYHAIASDLSLQKNNTHTHTKPQEQQLPIIERIVHPYPLTKLQKT